MTSPLNGPLEVGVRVLTVLTEAFPDHLDLNRLVLLDHGLLHSADLGGPESLHPAVPLRSSELGMKRERIQEGLEVLVRAGLAQMEPSAEGIHFWASDRATSFVRLLETDYAHALSERAAWVVEHFGPMDDADLREAMRSATGHWAEEFEHADPLSSEVGGIVIRLVLTHLTFVGSSVPPASIEFGPQLTLVRGPSDTGKSFIANAIDFMLGASNLKEIPERDGYSTVLLGLRLADDELVTLSRPVTGGSLGLHLSDLRTAPLPLPDQTLAPKHNPKSESNLSRYLLKQVGLDGKSVRKNALNATDTLSFRNLAHLCLVDETQMQADTPPALTGQYITRTKEVSVLKLMLQNEDDSHLVEEAEKQQKSRLDGARVEVIDRLLGELEAQLSETPEVSELRDQLARINASIEQQSGAVSGLTNQRSTVTARLREAQDGLNAARSELSEISALQGRFGLLQRQYESDLQRLATINEAGNLLGYFTPGVCAFCGAEPAHQHYNLECEGDETALHASVGAESAKTKALRDDLLLTLGDLVSRRVEVLEGGRAARDEVRRLEVTLQELDGQLAPQNNDLRELLAIRRDVEKSMGLYERVADLQRMKNQIEDDVATDAKAVSVGISLAAVREFSSELAQRLKAWGYPEADSVRYDRIVQDIQAGDQYRSSHGKGVRAILHGAFTLGLAQYCFDRDIPHPGFVVLDSPLVTYRPPDAPDTDLLDESLPKGVVEAFYRDVQTHFDGQIIVMENLDPTEALHGDSVDIPFTHRRDTGRYGFFPIDVGPQKLPDAAEISE